MNIAAPKIAEGVPWIETLVLLDDAQFDHSSAKRAASRCGLVGNILSFYMAEDLLDFLAIADRPVVDALLVDLHMPKMGGLEFLSEAANRFSKPIARSVYLSLTLDPSGDALAAIEDRTVDGWIEKPVTQEALLKVAKNLVELPVGEPTSRGANLGMAG